jgi:CRISPR-associated protein Csx10
MDRVRITIKAESPLSVGKTKVYGGTLVESGHYIAGAQLRGALAAIKDHFSHDERREIDKILGTCETSGVKFPNCYPSQSDDVLPLPLTAQACKRANGFIGDRRGGRDRHGIADTLLMQLAYDSVSGPRARWRIPLVFQYKCPVCGNRAEPAGGFAEYRGDHEHVTPEVTFHRQTRVAINRALQTAEEGQLYSVRAIDEGARFVGATEIDGGLYSLLHKWLTKVRLIGGRTTRGFGRVDVRVSQARRGDSVRNRLQRFNSKYREVVEGLLPLATPSPPEDDRILFTIGLRSDAILRNNEGAPTLRLDASMLSDVLNTIARIRGISVPKDITLLAQFTRALQTSGWQTAWNLPKEVLLTSSMGGLYVFSVDAKAVRLADIAGLLETLEYTGIGEMREDGYGQITICDPFHTEVNPV